MRIRHYPIDSRMSWYWKPQDSFEVYDDFGNCVLTLTGSELLAMLAKDFAHAGIIKGLIEKAGGLKRELYTKRQLKGQHKPLRTLPHSPHDGNPSVF